MTSTAARGGRSAYASIVFYPCRSRGRFRHPDKKARGISAIQQLNAEYAENAERTLQQRDAGGGESLSFQADCCSAVAASALRILRILRPAVVVTAIHSVLCVWMDWDFGRHCRAASRGTHLAARQRSRLRC
jgi:hypothetical protein